VLVASVSSVETAGDVTEHIDTGSHDDRSADDTAGIIGVGVSSQRNCTLCAGAITQDVCGYCL